jgi:hypothetical protein
MVGVRRARIVHDASRGGIDQVNSKDMVMLFEVEVCWLAVRNHRVVHLVIGPAFTSYLWDIALAEVDLEVISN